MKLHELGYIIRNAINEAIGFGFSLGTLKSIRTYAGKVRYCKQFLGQPIGNGTSRICFQLDDEKILKLAKNEKGIAQNEQEGQRDWFRDNYGIFPKVYYDLSDEDGYTYLVSEYVLPVKESDFKKCIGMSSNMFYNFLKQCSLCYSRNYFRKYFSDEEFEELLENNEYLNGWYDFMCNYQFFPSDLKNRNFGMAMRDGEPSIVMLDSGLSSEVYKKYYRKQ